MVEMERDHREDTPTGEIDVLALLKKIWSRRKLVLKCCIVGFVVGLVIAFSIPKEYTTSIVIAPESGQTGANSGLSSLASIAGINLGGTSAHEALNPDLYPNIVASTPFVLDLFSIPLAGMTGQEISLYEYTQELKSPWWSAVLSAPFKAIGWVGSLFKKDVQDQVQRETIDPFRLSRAQAGAVNTLKQRLAVMVDRKSGTVTLSVTMQNPVVSAALADSVLNRLKSYMIDYRTSKARQDLQFIEQLYEDAQQEYYTAQQRYARAADRNRDLVLKSVAAELERLQNEMTLAYGVYNQTAQQLAMAKAKVQEITPVFTVVEPATVPLQASAPRKMLILLAWLFLGGLVGCGWALVGDNMSRFLPRWHGKKEEMTE